MPGTGTCVSYNELSDFDYEALTDAQYEALPDTCVDGSIYLAAASVFCVGAVAGSVFRPGAQEALVPTLVYGVTA